MVMVMTVNAKTVPTELLQKAHSLLYLTKLKAASRGEIKVGEDESMAPRLD